MKNVFHLIAAIYLIATTFGLKILPNVQELTIASNKQLTLICEDDSPIQWIYPKSVNATMRDEIENGSFVCNLTIHSANFLDTGYFFCKSKADQKRSAEIYIYVFDEENLIALNDTWVIIHGNVNEDLVIPCKPTSPEVNVTLEGNNIEVVDPNYDPKVGYTLPSVQITDNGVITCLASFGASSVTYTFQIIIDPSADEITTPYIDATGSYHLLEGDNATLNCSSNASSGVRAVLEWQLPNDKAKDKVIIEANKEVSHEDHRTLYRILSIPNISKEDQGPYTCEVKDENFENKSSVHFLHVYELNSTFLNITVQAKAHQLTVRAGEPQVKWIVNVTAFPRPAITWYNPEGIEIINGPSHDGKYNVTNDGQITKLEINSISIEDFGIYQLRAFNAHHKATVDLTLLVEASPSVKINSDKEFYRYKKEYSIECISIAYPLPRMTWSSSICNDYGASTCNNTAFESISANNYEEVSISGNHLKSVYKFVADETKVVKCEASNAIGSSNSTSLILVADVDDGFAISHDANLIAVGDDVKVSCAASKYAYYNNITWFLVKGDDWVPVEHVPGINLAKTVTKFSHVATFSISNVQKTHNGNYVCQVTLLHRMPVEFAKKNISLDVQEVRMPSIINTNLNSSTWYVVSGKQIELNASVDGIPKPTIIWYKNGKRIESRQNDARLILKNANQTLLITYAAFSDEGSYSVVASNKVGNISAVIQLRLADKIEDHEHAVYIWGFLVLTVVFILCILWALIRIRKEKKSRKELEENGLLNFEEGALHRLNPELGVGDQADLLPYDRKWEFPIKKLKFGKQLGIGEFGVVMKAEADGIIKENTWTTVAVKMVKREADPTYIKALASELKIMIHLGRHLNVVNLLGACTKDINKRELMVIVEFCKYGNLREFISKQRNNFVNQINEHGEINFSICRTQCADYCAKTTENMTRFKNDDSIVTKETPIGSDGYLINTDNETDWRTNYCGDYRDTTVAPIKTADLICWSFQIARGMEYLANRKVLHGDLAARNVLLSDNNVVKICDFGLAKSMYSENYQMKKQVRLPIRWMAIESIRDRVFSSQSDVWSFGVTMWELFSLSIVPYPGVEHLENLLYKLLSGYRLEKPDYATKEIYAIMTDCWRENPSERPTFTELSERLGLLLEEGVQSHYTNLDEEYVKMNAEMNTSLDYYLTMLSSSKQDNFEEPRYVNIPRRETSKPEDEVESKPMLEKTETEMKIVRPVCFFNQSYANFTKTKTATYVNSVSS